MKLFKINGRNARKAFYIVSRVEFKEVTLLLLLISILGLVVLYPDYCHDRVCFMISFNLRPL